MPASSLIACAALVTRWWVLRALAIGSLSSTFPSGGTGAVPGAAAVRLKAAPSLCPGKSGGIGLGFKGQVAENR